MREIEKTVAITGGSSGIGKAIALRFAQEGFRVAFLGTDERRVAQTAQELTSAASRSQSFGRVCDLHDEEAIKTFFVDATQALGPIGILVNSAGISPKIDGLRIPSHEVSVSQFQDVLQVNLTAPLICAQQLLPAMMQQRFGRIIMIGSIAARALPRFAGSAYVASKAGLAGLARCLAAEYASFGITSNVVSPGNIASAMTGDVDSPQNQASIERIPLGRIGMPADIAGIVHFLARPEAEFINGATIDVTGGEYMTS